MGANRNKKIIAVVGPTASGKSSLATQIAKYFSGEILAVDSRTVYEGMDIGTAKPEGKTAPFKKGDISGLFTSLRPLIVDGVPNFGFDLIKPDEPYSIGEFKPFAEKVIGDIHKRGAIPVLVGGTALWMDAIVKNIELPNVEADQELRKQLDQKTTEDLLKRFTDLDPEGALVIDVQNKRRLIRAIEVCIKTGKTFSSFQKGGEQKYDALWIGVERSRDELYERINERVDIMIAKGLVDEVRGLKEQYGCEIQSMTGIGYRQICEFLEGKSSLKDAMEELKKDTRHYAKRQLTWLKRNEDIHWVKDYEIGVKLVKAFLQ